MAQYFLIYQGGNHAMSQDDQMAHQKKWMEWVAAQGSAMVEPQVVFKDKKTVSSSGVADYAGTPTMGYSLLEAESFDAAVKVAQACPFMDIGGEIVVAEKMSM